MLYIGKRAGNDIEDYGKSKEIKADFYVAIVIRDDHTEKYKQGR